MKVENIPIEFQKASGVIETLQENGYEAFFVGGSVRDVLLEKPIHDVDIATSAYPEEIKQLFPRTIDVGIEHGTVLVLFNDEQYEITTFRTESTYQDFRRPDSVTFVRSLKEDLKRRDFTINALAMNSDGVIVDLFDGMLDLKNKTIRAVGNPKERFHEDALRMMRGLRFASQLEFIIDTKTITAIEACHSLLEKISVERISMEFIKLLLGKNRQAGLVPFIETECYQYCPQLRMYGEQLLRFAALPNKQLQNEKEAWAMFLFVLGIPEKDRAQFLKEWKLSNQLIQAVQQIVRGLHLRMAHEWQQQELFDLGEEHAVAVENLLFYFGKKGNQEKVKEQYRTLPISNRKQLEISGKDLVKAVGKSPGKWVGDMLDAIESKVITGHLVNEKNELLAYAYELINEE